MIRAQMLRLLRRLGVSIVYETRVGMKVINPVDPHRCIPGLAGQSLGDLQPGVLRIGFDGLKDAHSNLGRFVVSSAHFGLMEALAGGARLESTEYAQRLEQGTLDWRAPTRFTAELKRRISATFRDRERALRAGDLPPITVIVLAGSFYIADGKHRAAMCALDGTSHRCVDVTSLLHDSAFRYRCYFRLRRNETHYRKHLDLLQPFYDGIAHPVLGHCG